MWFHVWGEGDVERDTSISDCCGGWGVVCAGIFGDVAPPFDERNMDSPTRFELMNEESRSRDLLHCYGHDERNFIIIQDVCLWRTVTACSLQRLGTCAIMGMISPLQIGS